MSTQAAQDEKPAAQSAEGYLRLRHNEATWDEEFALCDDDGIQFVVDNLRTLSGRYVRVTIEATVDPRYPHLKGAQPTGDDICRFECGPVHRER